MRRFRLEVDAFTLHFDRDYGIDRRKGWSVAFDGSFYVQLEPGPLRAVFKALRMRRACRRADIASAGLMSPNEMRAAVRGETDAR